MASKSKAERLKEKAVSLTRQPRPERLQPESEKKGYRVVAVSLYVPEANWIDQITKALKRAGSPKANRSLIVREAILRLQEELEDKTPEEILHDFIDREAKRTQRL